MVSPRNSHERSWRVSKLSFAVANPCSEMRSIPTTPFECTWRARLAFDPAVDLFQGCHIVVKLQETEHVWRSVSALRLRLQYLLFADVPICSRLQLQHVHHPHDDLPFTFSLETLRADCSRSPTAGNWSKTSRWMTCQSKPFKMASYKCLSKDWILDMDKWPSKLGNSSSLFTSFKAQRRAPFVWEHESEA